MTDNGEDVTGAVARPSVHGPQIRWGGVVWGAILIAISVLVLYTLSSRDRERAFELWVTHLQPESAWTLAVVAVGIFILIMALLTALRSAQRKRRA